MKQKLKNNQIVVGLILILLLIAIVLTVRLSSERQIIQKRAAGTNEVSVSLSPASGTFGVNQRETLTVHLTKTAERTISISGAEAVITVDDKFTIHSVACSSAFDGLKLEQIGGEQLSGQHVTLMCTTNIGTTPLSLTTTPLAFATIVVSVRPTASTGLALISFTATRVTEAGVAGQAPDVSTVGQTGNYTISDVRLTPTIGPTSGATPTPGAGTPSPTSTQTGCPSQKVNGDYNCDSVVNEEDFTAWRRDFIGKSTILEFFEYWRRSFYQTPVSPTPTTPPSPTST